MKAHEGLSVEETSCQPARCPLAGTRSPGAKEELLSPDSIACLVEVEVSSDCAVGGSILEAFADRLRDSKDLIFAGFLFSRPSVIPKELVSALSEKVESICNHSLHRFHNTLGKTVRGYKSIRLGCLLFLSRGIVRVLRQDYEHNLASRTC